MNLSSDEPFYLTVTARILKSPIPDVAITLRAYLNAFEPIPNRSIGNIVCIFPPPAKDLGKHIEIWPRGWPNYNTGEKDMRKKFRHITIHPGSDHVVRHEISRSKIASCNPERGEKYRVQLTDKALGSRFWCWGDLQDPSMERVKYGAGPFTREDFEGEGREDWSSLEYGEESVWFKGEIAEQLALVVEKGDAEFEVI